ncbi:16291_t:CDS:2, partial [Racocetra fulgida]
LVLTSDDGPNQFSQHYDPNNHVGSFQQQSHYVGPVQHPQQPLILNGLYCPPNIQINNLQRQQSFESQASTTTNQPPYKTLEIVTVKFVNENCVTRNNRNEVNMNNASVNIINNNNPQDSINNKNNPKDSINNKNNPQDSQDSKKFKYIFIAFIIICV